MLVLAGKLRKPRTGQFDPGARTTSGVLIGERSRASHITQTAGGLLVRDFDCKYETSIDQVPSLFYFSSFHPARGVSEEVRLCRTECCGGGILRIK